MNDLNTIQDFLRPKKIALFGASRSGKKFGNVVLKELQTREFQIYPVHPECTEINGIACISDVSGVPDDVEAALMVIPPDQVITVLPALAEKKMRYVWLQPGSESGEAIKLCQELDIEVISDKCILMFTEPVRSIHRFHRWIWKVTGKFPDIKIETITE